MPFRTIYSPEANEQLRALAARQQAIVLNAVERQLTHQPDVETRNRKRMRANPITPWELRVGDLRVYYHIVEEPEAAVEILAIGIKLRNRARIGREVHDL